MSVPLVLAEVSPDPSPKEFPITLAFKAVNHLTVKVFTFNDVFVTCKPYVYCHTCFSYISDTALFAGHHVKPNFLKIYWLALQFQRPFVCSDHRPI